MASHTTKSLETTDPLVLLPAEIVLRILEYATLSSVASLTQLTRGWHAFIDETHQDAIYSSISKADRPLDAKDFTFANNSLADYSKYYNDLQSWKDLCRRQTLLSKSWNRQRPVTRESIIQVGNDPVWRFRPDFKRRYFLSTSQMGGMNVTDMDSGDLLWRLDMNTVRPFAHLEYQDGTAVWDREGDAVEVWKTDIEGEGLNRGQFKRVAVLEHDCQTRGFQLTKNILCVVSSEGKGFVYDLSGKTRLLREIDIETGAVGHLDQGSNVVAYSIGHKGYHFYQKDTGTLLGVLHPKHTSKTYHIPHPKSRLDCRLGVGSRGQAAEAYPPLHPGKNRTIPLKIKKGAQPQRPDAVEMSLEDDEWGAGMLNGNLFVGISKGGRVFVCHNWRKALESAANFQEVTTNIETESNGTTFDLGGWLAIRAHKIMFETQDRAYIVGLNDDNTVKADDENPQRPSIAYATSSAAQLAMPVSFMGIYDDCIMTTYTCLRYRQRLEANPGGAPIPAPARIMPTKVIRVLSFAPNLENLKADEEIVDTLDNDDPAVNLPEMNTMRSDLIQLIAMLEGEPELEEHLGFAEEPNLDDDLGMEEWLGEDEWEDAEEGDEREESELERLD